jgi:hypothetical protein
MPSKPLDNLVRIGKLKAESPSRLEFAGLVRSGRTRLKDAANTTLHAESRFDLAYNAAHALSLAALIRIATDVQKRVSQLAPLPPDETPKVR